MPHKPHEPASTTASWGSPAPLPQPKSSRLLPVLGVVFGLLGLIAGTAAWFRAAPASPAGVSYSAEQVADAKKAVCEAYAKGWRSLQVAGSKKKPDDPTDSLPIVSVNGRVAEVAVGNWLINSADTHLAAPTELRILVRQLGEKYEEIVLTQIADGTRTEVLPIAQDADKVRAQIEQLCL